MFKLVKQPINKIYKKKLTLIRYLFIAAAVLVFYNCEDDYYITGNEVLRKKRSPCRTITKIIKTILLLTWGITMSQELPVLSTTSLANPEDKLDHPKNGNYAIDTNSEHDQYVGTWQYTQNNIIFILKIAKADRVLNKIEYQDVISSYRYADEMLLRYKLVKNGIVIFDNITTPVVSQIKSYGMKHANSDAYGRILDHTRNVVGSYTIKKSAAQPDKIIFNLILGNYTLLNERSYYNDGQPLFSIPINGVEMVKVN